tara:strand:- start:179 stop:400 length:222 start_codon:yes stop_codon:yes gene_type:complete
MYFKHIITLNIFILLFCSFSAESYIGPGMSGGAIIAVLGFVIAIFAALFGLVYFPIKRIFLKVFKKEKNKKKK